MEKDTLNVHLGWDTAVKGGQAYCDEKKKFTTLWT